MACCRTTRRSKATSLALTQHCSSNSNSLQGQCPRPRRWRCPPLHRSSNQFTYSRPLGASHHPASKTRLLWVASLGACVASGQSSPGVWLAPAADGWPYLPQPAAVVGGVWAPGRGDPPPTQGQGGTEGEGLCPSVELDCLGRATTGTAHSPPLPLYPSRHEALRGLTLPLAPSQYLLPSSQSLLLNF